MYPPFVARTIIKYNTPVFSIPRQHVSQACQFWRRGAKGPPRPLPIALTPREETSVLAMIRGSRRYHFKSTGLLLGSGRWDQIAACCSLNKIWAEKAREITWTASCFFHRQASHDIHVYPKRSMSTFELRSRDRRRPHVKWWPKTVTCVSVMSLDESLGICALCPIHFSGKVIRKKRVRCHLTWQDLEVRTSTQFGS